MTVKVFGIVIDRYKDMKNTLKFFWPILLAMFIIDEYAVWVGHHMSKWWMHLIILGLLGLTFVMFHKIKRKI